MSLETFLGIVCLAGAVISYGISWYASENVYLKYKDQKVGGKKKS